MNNDPSAVGLAIIAELSRIFNEAARGSQRIGWHLRAGTKDITSLDDTSQVLALDGGYEINIVVEPKPAPDLPSAN
jgi:hypothetical protein